MGSKDDVRSVIVLVLLCLSIENSVVSTELLGAKAFV